LDLHLAGGRSDAPRQAAFARTSLRWNYPLSTQLTTSLRHVGLAGYGTVVSVHQSLDLNLSGPWFAGLQLAWQRLDRDDPLQFLPDRFEPQPGLGIVNLGLLTVPTRQLDDTYAS